MMLLSRSGSFTVDLGMDERMVRQKATIDLPAGLADQRADLYDEMFDFTFDVLGVQVVELRVRAPGRQATQPQRRPMPARPRRRA